MVVENTLTEFLKTSSIGRGVIGCYKRTGILKEKCLKDLVIVHELEHDLSKCK